MEPEGSLKCSQEPSTDPYSEPDQSNPLCPISLRPILMLSTHLNVRDQVSYPYRTTSKIVNLGN
jgi:hypothetical protein